jgi:hypothetical protein
VFGSVLESSVRSLEPSGLLGAMRSIMPRSVLGEIAS